MTVTLGDWLPEAPFNLVFSSELFGFFSHCGFFLVLEEAEHFPGRVAGSIAGALITGAWVSASYRGAIHPVTSFDHGRMGAGVGFGRHKKGIVGEEKYGFRHDRKPPWSGPLKLEVGGLALIKASEAAKRALDIR